MMRQLVAFATVVVLGLAGAFAQKQVQARYRQDYPLYLLRHPSVQKDLKLSAAAVSKIEKIRKSAESKYMAMISPTVQSPNRLRRPTQAEIEAHQKETDLAMLRLMTSAQKARLREIGYQYGGAFSLAEPRVYKALSLTPEQMRLLEDAARKVMIKHREQTSSLVKRGSIVNRDIGTTAQKLLAAKLEMMRAMDSAASKILTESQRARWKKMKGRPFAVEKLFAPVSRRKS